MNAPLLNYRMTVEQFLDWADARAASLAHDEPKWELFDGVPEMQEHERWDHDRIKLTATLALRDAVRRSGLPFEIAIDGLGVRIARNTSYQPEVVVFPAGLINGDDRYAPDPVIVIEVLSPSTRNKDLRTKVDGYGRVASIQHYLVLDPDTRQVLLHRRQGTALVADPQPLATGTLHLDPPGLSVDVGALFT